ncbi:hypothetical protein ElyMa_000291200 [Elysia marginata]|uniref:Uncharacterized protein n=1 Tax=Elysia marginata TaxID=1093978 RepID=A0AAV4F6I6_9GAST|nr:hypothetical protein ElyMa_000291200 [Elysia marginata]
MLSQTAEDSGKPDGRRDSIADRAVSVALTVTSLGLQRYYRVGQLRECRNLVSKPKNLHSTKLSLPCLRLSRGLFYSPGNRELLVVVACPKKGEGVREEGEVFHAALNNKM